MLLTLAADRLVGFLSPPEARTAGIIALPNIRVAYRTTEFSTEVVINNLGFRDHDVIIHKGPTPRVLAIGDSFTYGWGVALEDAWPKVVERKLQSTGLDVEVFDLGVSGGYPRLYADVADRAVPLLHPDLVVVAVLQGDDLAQSLPTSLESLANAAEATADASPRRRLRAGLQSFFRLAYPNIDTLVARHDLNPFPLNIDINAQWRDQAQHLVDGLTAQEREHYGRIDPQARQMLLEGNLNPSLVALSIKKPEFYEDTLHPEKPAVSTGIAEMGRQLARIKRVADINGARVLVTSVPHGMYVSSRDLDTRARLGFTVVPSMLTLDLPDALIERAVEQAGLPFDQVTDAFRGQHDSTALYFEWDGHLTPAGQDLYGTALAPLIQQWLAPPAQQAALCWCQ